MNRLLPLMSLSALSLFGASSVVSAATHTGTNAATHMQIKNGSGVVQCYVYNTPSTTRPVANGCPTGTYTEQLFNSSWKQIGGNRSVTIGTTPPPQSGTHTGARAATHMQIKNSSGSVVCYVYNTSASSRPVARGCPNGTFIEQLFDSNWKQIAPNRTVTIGGSTPDTGTSSNTEPKFRQHQNKSQSQLSYYNNNHTIRDSRALVDTAIEGNPGDGNFRVTCQWSHLSYDDPIVYPNKPGKSHLHMYFGNTKANASTTTKNRLVGSGGGTCNGYELNRSAYWVPALLNGKGKVVIPKQILVYYKTSTVCRPGENPVRKNGIDTCSKNNPLYTADQVREMNQGLKLIAGHSPSTPFTKPTEHLFWSCGKNGRATKKQARIPTNCGAGEPINATIYFPQCWNGSLDSSDHRSHLKQVGVGAACPSSHKYRLPRLGYLLYYYPESGESTSKWRLSSDHSGMKPGSSLHADWIGGWHVETMRTWIRECLRKKKNCNIGQTGNGRSLKRLNGSRSDDWNGQTRFNVPARP